MIFSKTRKARKKKLKKVRENLLNQYPASSRFAESYRTLRTNLFFSVMEKELKSVVVTSSVEGEGKTTTCFNLAHAIAQSDRKVLIMDMDLRRRHLSTLIEPGHDTGISDIVADTFGTRLTEGRLEEYSINDLIRLTRLQKRTCILDLENGDTRAALYFENGKMTDIWWKNRPDEKKLANTLIRNNLLSKEDARLALGHQKQSVKRLGTILYTMGFVSRKDIDRTLSVHSIEAVKAASAMETGRFEFSALRPEGMEKSLDQTVDFEQLYKEFTVSAGRYIFLKAAIDRAVIPTDTPNLYLMPAGPAPSNPSEMAGSDRTRYLIEYLKHEFDFIILDTPPVLPASDALLLAPHTDGTILVIKAGRTHRKAIKNTVEQFNTTHLPIIGTVLNQVDMKHEGYYRYYKKYYASYYGK